MKEIRVSRTASRGIAIGKAFIVEKISLEPDSYNVSQEDLKNETQKYDEAVSEAVRQLELLAEDNDIFGAHLEIVMDAVLTQGVHDKILQQSINVQRALKETAVEWISMFEAMEDEYMRERAADIKDICDRLMRILKGIDHNPFDGINEPVIIVAEDLAPSDTANLNLKYVLGFITQEGGITSHVSIMAKNIGLPALVGVKGILDSVRAEDMIIMDAKAGQILINPEKSVILKYMKQKKVFDQAEAELVRKSRFPAVTSDGHEVSVYANIGSVEEADALAALHIKGVGLLRSEFLYMESKHFPTEDEQFEAYKAIACQLEEEVTIRTLDIGGDKTLSYFEFEHEENPYLGWRAIRISLEMKEMFRAQIRALLRASIFGPVRIMFPMIIAVEELREARGLVEECKKELRAEDIPFNENIQVGMMIETPASVMCAEEFAKEVDFFSIGTNDLTQYMLAVDRGNKKVAPLYNSFHPAVIKSIQKVIEAGHANGIKVGMCGEFASDEQAVKLLLGMGLDEFSMSAASIPLIKDLIRSYSYQDAKQYADTYRCR
ncbi:phosphoenolpyruvate--protein phosphotransferase [Faecalicatena contorta]|uniref:Phosphoenolpyruvate-protein phosphotransferase n=1 Tax=Faecalicatena contorta TaxID=39482 RepID=A0A316A010_9FIRM|nr:phosphoenolpyruvate--protein phosphotransferase [Faecalicatena contorta]PWJ50528.1 phosphotransferase system enzyme I (PtsI) [Faecalicatena contorta]SUQ13936.1 phosphotransferase system, enzyme I, PtsI [Faecalicatena contorta]